MKQHYNFKHGLFAFFVALFWVPMYSQTTYTLNFTGSSQTISLAAGNYAIECWGADGGSLTANTGLPGRGGYSKGSISLAAPTIFTVYIGGKGNGGAQPLGGFNSGNGTTKTNITTATGGGGASDVRVLADDFFHRIIVAGGGGGQGTATGTGGNGGGLVGQNGQGTTNAGVGGSQTAPGVYPGGGDAKVATFGEGSDGPAGTTGGQGGGGWYGGSFGTRTNGGGAGGSGYVLTPTSFTPSGYFAAYTNYFFTNAITFRADEVGFVTNPDISGNGLVLITELCNISLQSSSSGTANAVICSGQSLTLTTNATSNYSWSTGATTSSLVVAPTTNTVYSLTATSPANCTASKSISITVSSGQPTLSVTSSTNQTCLGKTATLTASGAVTYTWSNGVINGVSFFPSATITYSVIGENGCGTVQAVSTISVAPLAISVVSSGTAVCTNKTATLTASAAATSYTWNPGNITGTSPNLIVNPQANTVYTITATDGTCVGVTNISLQADPVPTITSSSSATLVCPGGTVNLSATGGINYTWTPVNLNGSSVTVSPTASTLYNVQGDNSFGCYNSSSQVIVVGVQPTLGVSTNISTICDGGSATLTANGANGYAWMGGPTTNSYVVSPNQNTTYTVVGTNSTSGCTDMKTISINVFSPTLAITGNTVICNGASSNLSATGGVSYTWNPGGLPFQGISVSPTSNSIYTVSGIANQGALNCPVSATVEITVNPTPTVTAVANPTAICPKQTATITANGASTYTWVSTNTTIVNSSINVTAPSVSILVYSLTGTNAQGCESSIIVPFSVSPCTGINDEALASTQLNIYPNPSNGEFTITGSGEKNLVLINELGQVVNKFELNSKNAYTFKVSHLNPGIYFVTGTHQNFKIVVTK